ncbi:S8 family peptidase [Trichothermofontia sichuanensis B231]|uniref:S8 family peptidase n=1 Tax=Trichothermofontia sichuanensis TaxID=3045816 RepID=UPI00224562E7|nr:S8 family peptidase [Trichothermofontia sichuanensis]UZQ55574.1 S8 family peptidase [Trichothermofontia sichuanensis B231]
MKKVFGLGLFLIGMVAALWTYLGSVNQGEFDSIILDFQEVPATQIEPALQTLTQVFGLTPRLNSPFAQAEQVYIVSGDRSQLRALRRSPLAKLTERIEPNYRYHALEIPNDPDYPKQWNLRSINLEPAWERTKGAGVTVAVIDTGITPVPDLAKTEIVEGYDFVNDRPEATDDNGHGTHVAGTIAQSTNNDYGVAGIAYQAKLMPLKVLSASGAGEVADIADAIRFAADHDADVINLSLGGGGESHVLRDAIDYAHDKGVVIVAAVGNANQNAATYPARYPHVIGVAALGPAGDKAPYSNFGAGIDIAAPGGSKVNGDLGGILQNTIDPETGAAIFAAYEGTSMAAPHVAGVAALVKASGIDNPDEVANVLQKAARAVPDDGLNYYGAGQLDAAQAVQLAEQGKVDFHDFFRWLRENGYLNPRFWIDGGVAALVPKLLMVLGSYLLAIFLRYYFPYRWTWGLGAGLVAGSSGLFFLRGFYIFDLPQWPFRLMGSGIAEWGNAIQGSSLLNPWFASVLIPFALVVLCLSHPQGKGWAIGTAIGMTIFLTTAAIIDPALLWLGAGLPARLFLGVNALLCLGLARLALKTEGQPT